MDEKKWWIDYPWRLVQTNMRQIDWADISAEQYVRDLKEFGATVVLLNAAGIIANYPAGREYETVNPYLTGDSIANIIDACHKAGIRVLARTDFSKIREPVYQRHPDWAFRTAAGDIVNYNGDVHVCPNGPYQQDYMFRIIGDMLSRLPFDGIFYNMGGFQSRDYSYRYYGLCHCENCRRKFRERFGLEIPGAGDLKDPAYRRYKVFQDQCMEDLDTRLSAHVRAISGQIAINGLDYQRIESNTEIGRPLPQWQYSASSNTRNSRNLNYGIIPSNTTVDFIGFPYRHVSVSAHLQELRLWQNLANLGAVDYYLIGRLDNHGDKSGYEGVKKVFRFARENYEELRGLRNLAAVLVLHQAHWDDDPEVRGWVRVLTETHIPLEEARIGRLSLRDLAPFKAVILPDLKYVSPQQAAVLDDFVRSGGVLLASGEAGFYDNHYEQYDKIPLKSLGIAEVLYHRRDVLSAMLLADEAVGAGGIAGMSGPATRKYFPHFTDVRYVACGQEFINVRMEEGAEAWMPFLPPQPFGPPERCYALNPAVDTPGVTRFPFGKGAGIYVPWKPGTLFYREGYPNTAWFMQDLLERLCGLASLAPALSPMVEATLSGRPLGDAGPAHGALVVQLVNTSGHYGNSFYAPVPIRDLALEIPAAGTVKTVRTLRRREKLRWSLETVPAGKLVKLRLPLLEDYEGIVIELKG
ncbi:MAG: hypothetical protein LBQ46_11480 [Treponema sp.]|jgi:hypothetical protein|nr:hypothetical protein [Treponema sp.]